MKLPSKIAIVASASFCLAAPLVLDRPKSSATTLPPAAVKHALVVQKKGFGTIKGRLVWGGGEAPTPKVLVKKGKATSRTPSASRPTSKASRSLSIPRPKA